MIISTWKLVFPLTLCLALNMIFTEANSGLLEAKRKINHKRNDQIHSYRQQHMGSAMSHQSQMDQMRAIQQMQQYQAQYYPQQMQYYPQQQAVQPVQSQLPVQHTYIPQQIVQPAQTVYNAPVMNPSAATITNQYKADVMNPPVTTPSSESRASSKNLVLVPNQKPTVEASITPAETDIHKLNYPESISKQQEKPINNPSNTLNNQYQTQSPVLPFNQYQPQYSTNQYIQYPTAQLPATQYNQYSAAQTQSYNPYITQAQQTAYNRYSGYPYASQQYSQYLPQQFSSRQEGINQFTKQQERRQQHAAKRGQRQMRKSGQRGQQQQVGGAGAKMLQAKRGGGGGRRGQGGRSSQGAGKMMQAKSQARGRMAAGVGQRKMRQGARGQQQQQQVGGAGAKMLQAKQQRQSQPGRGRKLRRNPKNNGRQQLAQNQNNVQQNTRNEVSSELIEQSFKNQKNKNQINEEEYQDETQQYDAKEYDYTEETDEVNDKASKSDLNGGFEMLSMKRKPKILDEPQPKTKANARKSFREFRAKNFKKNLGNIKAAEKYLNVKDKLADEPEIVIPQDELMALVIQHETESQKSADSNLKKESAIFQSAYIYDENANILDATAPHN